MKNLAHLKKPACQRLMTEFEKKIVNQKQAKKVYYDAFKGFHFCLITKAVDILRRALFSVNSLVTLFLAMQT